MVLGTPSTCFQIKCSTRALRPCGGHEPFLNRSQFGTQHKLQSLYSEAKQANLLSLVAPRKVIKILSADRLSRDKACPMQNLKWLSNCNWAQRFTLTCPILAYAVQTSTQVTTC